MHLGTSRFLKCHFRNNVSCFLHCLALFRIYHFGSARTLYIWIQRSMCMWAFVWLTKHLLTWAGYKVLFIIYKLPKIRCHWDVSFQQCKLKQPVVWLGTSKPMCLVHTVTTKCNNKYQLSLMSAGAPFSGHVCTVRSAPYRCAMLHFIVPQPHSRGMPIINVQKRYGHCYLINCHRTCIIEKGEIDKCLTYRQTS